MRAKNPTQAKHIKKPLQRRNGALPAALGSDYCALVCAHRGSARQLWHCPKNLTLPAPGSPAPKNPTMHTRHNSV